MKSYNQVRPPSSIRKQSTPLSWDELYAWVSMIAGCSIASSHVEAAWAIVVAVIASRILCFLLVGE